FEGLPVVAIENQANGCPTFLSSEITRETQISTDIDFIDLKKELWYKKIIEYIETHKTPRTDLHFDIQASGYDIKTEAQKLQEIYIDLWNKN
ncbi:glycosyltransferase family 1 protein, partial [Phocaeicola vulgatus]